MGKQFGNLSIREILIVTSAYARTSVQSRGGRRGVLTQPDAGRRMPSFLVSEVNNMAAGSSYARFLVNILLG